jgi:hypothetical protein
MSPLSCAREPLPEMVAQELQEVCGVADGLVRLLYRRELGGHVVAGLAKLERSMELPRHL